MSFNRCRFCDHRNPADARFCSACGGALHLVPCPVCGAVSDITATVCYQCSGQLPGLKTDALQSDPPATSAPREATPPLPAGDTPASPPLLPALAIVGIAGVVGLMGVIGYYHRQHTVVEESRPLSAGNEASKRGKPADTEPKEGIASERGTRADAEPKEATVSSSPHEVGEDGKPTPLPSKPGCTDPVAALDLCPPQSVPPGQTETAQPTTNASGAVNASTQEPSRPECSDAVTALGLCAPDPTQRKN